MSRLKSFGFPIAVVIVLVYFALRLFTFNSGSSTTPTWNQFAEDAAAGKVTYLKSDVNASSVTFSEYPDKSHKYTIGVPTPHQMDRVIATIPATATPTAIAVTMP